MLNRAAFPAAQRLAQGFPVLAITGPRQSGKTTLARVRFAGKPYVTLEDPEEREFAGADPHGFLARFPEGAVFDEAQRCPSLFSYLQGVVDKRRRMGEFILTGSQQFGLLSNIAQSLAGRVGLLQSGRVGTPCPRGDGTKRWAMNCPPYDTGLCGRCVHHQYLPLSRILPYHVI